MRAEHFPRILAHIPKIMPTLALHCPAGLYVQDILQESAFSLYSARVNLDTSQNEKGITRKDAHCGLYSCVIAEYAKWGRSFPLLFFGESKPCTGN